MPPTHDPYQRYAELLGEPVTDDLKVFVDAINTPLTSLPLPESLRRFAPSTSLQKEEDHTMTYTFPPLSSSAPARPPEKVTRRSRWSWGLVAAIVLIGLLASTYLVITQFPPSGTHPRTTVPQATLTPEKRVITCIGIYLIPSSQCDTIPRETTIDLTTYVNVSVCWKQGTPMPSNLYLVFVWPDGHRSGNYLVINEDNTGLPSHPESLCASMGQQFTQTGSYTVQAYWQGPPILSDYQETPTPAVPGSNPHWQLQIETSVVVR